MKKEYLNNIFYEIYENYPLFIFKEFKNSFNETITFLNINKIKLDIKNKILFFVENKESFMYIPLAKTNNINTTLFNDVIKNDNIDMAIISSLKNIEDIDNENLIDIEENFNVEGKKVPFEFFKGK